MTKEIEQAAKAAGKQYRETHLSQYNSRYQEHGENDYAKGFEAGVTSPVAKAYHEAQGWVSVEDEKQSGHTLGKLISDSITMNRVGNVPDIPADIFEQLKNDNFWPNSIPIYCFRNMMRLLNISILSVVPAIYETVKILEEKKKTESEPNFRIDTRSDLWECKEAVDKYISRLSELI